MSKYVDVGIQLPIDSEWNKMSGRQPPTSQEPTSTQVSTSNTEDKRYIYENIKIGDDCLAAAVSVNRPMMIRDYEMGNRSADVKGEVSEERTERMLLHFWQGQWHYSDSIPQGMNPRILPLERRQTLLSPDVRLDSVAQQISSFSAI
jgi:hypothetical protein